MGSRKGSWVQHRDSGREFSVNVGWVTSLAGMRTDDGRFQQEQAGILGVPGPQSCHRNGTDIQWWCWRWWWWWWWWWWWLNRIPLLRAVMVAEQEKWQYQLR